MKERVEDLGRIYERIDMLLKHDLFESRTYRPKDYLDWLERNPEEGQEYIRKIPYFIEEIQEELLILLRIAEGEDESLYS